MSRKMATDTICSERTLIHNDERKGFKLKASINHGQVYKRYAEKGKLSGEGGESEYWRR